MYEAGTIFKLVDIARSLSPCVYINVVVVVVIAAVCRFIMLRSISNGCAHTYVQQLNDRSKYSTNSLHQSTEFELFGMMCAVEFVFCLYYVRKYVFCCVYRHLFIHNKNPLMFLYALQQRY